MDWQARAALVSLLLIVLFGGVAAVLEAWRARSSWLNAHPRWSVHVAGALSIVVLAFVVVFFILVLPFTGVPDAVLFWRIAPYIDPTTAEERAALVQAQVAAAAVFVQLFSGTILIGTLFYTLGTIRLTAEGNRIAQDQLKLSEEGLNTDRFIRAIDQLGTRDEKNEKNLEVRLGGIYALERLSQDSPRDHQVIMDVLAAYVRTNAPAPPADGSEASDDSGPKYPAVDIQAILSVIRRRPEALRGNVSVALFDTNLKGASLSGAHLEGVNFYNARLNAAYLMGAHLERAYLGVANLKEAVLAGANLRDAVLAGANLEKANLIGAHLEKSDLSGARLIDSKLVGAHLERANLEGAHLEGAVFFHTQKDIDETTALMRSRHNEAWRSSFMRIFPMDPDLDVGAVPAWMVEPVHLQGANLSKVVGLTQDQIDHSYMDENTILPEGPGPDGQPYRRSSRQAKVGASGSG